MIIKSTKALEKQTNKNISYKKGRLQDTSGTD